MDAGTELPFSRPSEGLGELVELAAWRVRRDRDRDVPMGAPPFVLEEPCPGCGAERVATMVWREAGASRIPLPRMEPHFECRSGHVVHQEITDAPLPVTAWSSILGRFREEPAV